MAPSASFLSSALAVVVAAPEYAAFQAALQNISLANDDTRQAAWAAAYNDGVFGGSPAMRLKQAIRNAVANTQYSTTTYLGQSDSESAYQQIASQLVAEPLPPTPVPVLSAVFTSDDISMLRSALQSMTDT